MNMILTPEIWRTALAMMSHYGDTAAGQAVTRAAAHLARGNMGHTAAWQKVADAIILLQSERRGPDDTIH
jgi:hypothetical protein